ncbi:M15 family metallopeptidase [Elizabethkingia meningoseptica]|uniref:M15 family metallopeptidase n=1 Tax=Elizabethkingia meningoseptica TaxID=238 RepID=UPI0023B03A48|nr:M15 family metallopeptidase [Elizabethkingia meningoseptica]MDE5525676.1 M15 family metallopeptidase [Elizabethkingia meningoseptica]
MDKVTQQRIALLHPKVRPEVTKIINECNARLTGRAQVRIAQGLRTNQEQAALYAQGRTTPGKIVTNAKPGQSIHNYGLAVDIVLIIDGKEASWDTKKDWDGDGIADWYECVQVFKTNGWDWGGDWRTFKDLPHFEKRGYTWKDLVVKKRDKENYVIL